MRFLIEMCIKWLVLAYKAPQNGLFYIKLKFQTPKMYFSELLNRSNTLYIEVPTNPSLTTFPMTQTRKMVHQSSSLGSLDLKWSNLVPSLQKLAFLDPFLDPKLTFQSPKIYFLTSKMLQIYLWPHFLWHRPEKGSIM